jgi:transcriptional regulator with XRE-family HTH domain
MHGEVQALIRGSNQRNHSNPSLSRRCFYHFMYGGCLLKTPLYYYRCARGWTQGYVAEQIGASTQSIGRWERGEVVLQDFHRQRLADLFEVSPDKLFGRQSQRLEGENNERLLDPLLPPLPKVVGREAELRQLKQWLCEADASSPTIALYGLPGIGKTALALALADDEDVQERFPDGVLWAGVGLHASTNDLLVRWGNLLEIRSLDTTGTTLPQAITTEIDARRMLIILDDVWRMEHLRGLQVGGRNCVYLLTTRSPLLASETKHRLWVQELGEEESMALLGVLVPRVSGEMVTHSLIQAVGGLPLALTLIGNYLRMRASGSRRRIQDALDRLEDVQQRLILEEPAPAFSFPQRQVSLQACIHVSLEAVSESARRALGALSRLPRKPHSFSEQEALDAMGALGTTAHLDELCDVGLIEDAGNGRYQLHPVIADFAHYRIQK